MGKAGGRNHRLVSVSKGTHLLWRIGTGSSNRRRVARIARIARIARAGRRIRHASAMRTVTRARAWPGQPRLSSIYTKQKI